MTHEEAKNYIEHKISGKEVDKLWSLCHKEDIEEAAAFIKELTNCDDAIAKVIALEECKLVKSALYSEDSEILMHLRKGDIENALRVAEDVHNLGSGGNEDLEYVTNLLSQNPDVKREYDLAVKRRDPNTPKCPYCNSVDLKKIGTGSRLVSIGFFGLASGKIGKQWHCNNCGSDF